MISLLINNLLAEFELNGGILHLSGNSGSGKTLLATIIASIVSRTKKVEWISTDGKDGFIRFLRRNIEHYGGIASNITITRVQGHEEVKATIESLVERLNPNIGLIIIDPITRILDMSRRDPILWGRALFEFALPTLTAIAETRDILVTITSEVREYEGTTRAIYHKKISQWVKRNLNLNRPYDLNHSVIQEIDENEPKDIGVLQLTDSGHAMLLQKNTGMEVS